MREKAVTCFSSAASVMKGPEGYLTSPAFSDLRWTLAGDQRDERMRLFGRKLLKRLEGLGMPFYPEVGLMDHRTAQQRYVTGADPWKPIESPYLDGVAIRFRHCLLRELEPRCWWLFAEIGFDVGRLAQIPVMWGGFADVAMPGLWVIFPGAAPAGWRVDRRTYGVRSGYPLVWDALGGV